MEHFLLETFLNVISFNACPVNIIIMLEFKWIARVTSNLGSYLSVPHAFTFRFKPTANEKIILSSLYLDYRRNKFESNFL